MTSYVFEGSDLGASLVDNLRDVVTDWPDEKLATELRQSLAAGKWQSPYGQPAFFGEKNDSLVRLELLAQIGRLGQAVEGLGYDSLMYSLSPGESKTVFIVPEHKIEEYYDGHSSRPRRRVTSNALYETLRIMELMPTLWSEFLSYQSQRVAESRREVGVL
jgi:hypothetical protein